MNKDLPTTPFFHKTSYSKQEIAINEGKVFGEGRPQLPTNEMLMLDEITKISQEGGSYGRGYLEACLNINPDKWFFKCHFPGDPVMPGCLGLDAMWQLGGFYLGWLGFPGKGRAIGAGGIKFSGQVTQNIKQIIYKVDISRIMSSKIKLVVCDGSLWADGKLIYSASGLKIAIF